MAGTRPPARASSTARASESPIGGWHGYDGVKRLTAANATYSSTRRHPGLLLRARVTAVDVGDGAAMLLHDARAAFPRLRYDWVDAGYRGPFLQRAKGV